MEKRPSLKRSLDSETFRSYYYLKKELVEFCRVENLKVSGSKGDLTERIAHYLETGNKNYDKDKKNKIPKKTVAIDKLGEIAIDNTIEKNFVCSQKHRNFFKKEIGDNFHFNVAFQKWLKENTGKTYKEAIDAYHKIIEEKKNNKGKKKIAKQFQYNRYIRDFFKSNKGKTLDEAIKCWNYKKSIKGHNSYEDDDLIALKD